MGALNPGTLTIDRQLAVVNGYGPYLKPPKSQAGNRVLPLATRVDAVLAQHVRDFPPVEVTLSWGRPDGIKIAVELLFTDENGEPITRKAWSIIWRDVCARAGVIARYHDLRHFAVSSMIRHGATILEVRDFAGHSDARTTLSVYGHLWPDSEDRTRSALDAALDFGANRPTATDERVAG